MKNPKEAVGWKPTSLEEEKLSHIIANHFFASYYTLGKLFHIYRTIFFPVNWEKQVSPVPCVNAWSKVSTSACKHLSFLIFGEIRVKMYLNSLERKSKEKKLFNATKEKKLFNATTMCHPCLGA